MAIAFIKGEVTRTYLKTDGKAPFFACTVKETFTDRDGEERVGGYHNVIAFEDNAMKLAIAEEGDVVDVQATIRYRPDERFTDENGKNPFQVSFAVNKVIKIETNAPSGDEDDPFA